MTTTTLTGQSRTNWRLSAVLDFATGTHARAAAMLVAFALLMFLPGFFQLPPIDRDEARFAQASKQMVETGNYVDIHFQDQVRYKKPIGIYWLQAAVVSTAEALGLPNALRTIWLYRIPSLLGAIGAVLLTYWTALAFVTRRGALTAAAMLAGSILLGVEARLAKTDAVLLFTVVAAMGAMARVYFAESSAAPSRDQGWGNPAIFWTALAGGMLIKGPVILLVVGLTIVTLAIADRSVKWLRTLRPLPGVIWFLLLVLPWFLAIVFRSGTSFFAGSVGHDMLAKVASGQESHGAPPGTYVLLFWFTFWPGAMLAGLAAPAVWRARREHGTKFLLAWLVPSWLVFELVATKLPHYVLPMYPAIAILIVSVLERGSLSKRRWLEFGTIWWLALPLVVIAAALTGLMLLHETTSALVWPLAAAAVLLGLVAWRRYRSEAGEHGLLLALSAAVVVSASVYGFVLPRLKPLFPSVALADVLAHAQCPAPQAAAVGFQEPSLVFLAGTATELTSPSGAAEFLAKGGCRFAFVEAESESAFLQRASAIKARYAAGPRIRGINYSSGRRVTVAVYRAEGAP